MKLFRVMFDGSPVYVEAPDFGAAVEAFKDAMVAEDQAAVAKGECSEVADRDYWMPESVEHLDTDHEPPIIRAKMEPRALGDALRALALRDDHFILAALLCDPDPIVASRIQINKWIDQIVEAFEASPR